MLSTVLELAGFAFLTAAAFLTADLVAGVLAGVAACLAVSGVALLLCGYALGRPGSS